MIKHKGDTWFLYTEDGTKVLGAHDTEDEAKAQERAIQAAKQRAAAAVALVAEQQALDAANEQRALDAGDEQHNQEPENLRQLHLRGALSAARTTMYDGREHLLVPVVALMDGVIRAVNAPTAERVTTATLTKAAHTWNGRPLVLGHPTRDGRQCSANDPDIEAAHRIGTIFNSRMSGSKLLMDAYVDPVRAEKVGGAEFVRQLREGEPIEVSVGAYVQTAAEDGTHAGRPYKATWLETVGDHLAFLPGSRGACSLDMGCGAHRTAETYLVTAEGLETLECPHLGTMATLLDETGTLLGEARGYVTSMQATEEGDVAQLEALETLAMTMATMLNNVQALTYKKRFPSLPETMSEKYMEAFRAAIGKEISAKNLKAIQAAHDAAHEMHDRTTALGAQCEAEWKWAEESRLIGLEGESFDERMQAVNIAVQKNYGNEQIAPSDAYAYAQQIYDDHVIVRKGDKLYSVNYTVGEDGEVTFEDDGLTEVRQEYVATAAAKEDCPTCKGSGNAGGNPCEACDGTGEMEKRAAAAVVDSELELRAAAGEAAFNAACRGQGETKMTKDQKDELISLLVADKYSGFTAGDEGMLEGASDERLESFRVAAESRANRERELKAAQEKPMTSEEFMQLAPPEIRDFVTRQQRQETELKASLITELKAAQAEYSEAELSVMQVDDLQRMARVAKVDPVKIDYSGRGVPRAAAEDNEEYTSPDPYEAGIKVLQQQLGR